MADAPSFRSALLDFFDERARDLPWRRTSDPYAVWVSEVMLQQTRVETVMPYYEAWMERYPDVEALAGADLDDVLKSWEGMGYYRRARMLHRAATVVRDRHDGRVPGTAEELRELPGVGAYTAGAIASIAFDRPEPAVDGNVRRVLSRLNDWPDPTPSELESAARELIDPERPGDFNQALMELGATICTPRSPECGGCPVAFRCLAYERGTQEVRPAPKARPPVPEATFAVAVVVRPGRGGGEVGGRGVGGHEVGGAGLSGPEVVVRRRPREGLLAGLWEFPAERLEAGDGGPEGADRDLALLAAVRRTLEGLGIRGAAEPTPLVTVDHAFSHLSARYEAYLVEADAEAGVEIGPGGAFGGEADSAADGGAPSPDPQGIPRFHPIRALGDLALPVAQRKIADALRARVTSGADR